MRISVGPSMMTACRDNVKTYFPSCLNDRSPRFLLRRARPIDKHLLRGRYFNCGPDYLKFQSFGGRLAVQTRGKAKRVLIVQTAGELLKKRLHGNRVAD